MKQLSKRQIYQYEEYRFLRPEDTDCVKDQETEKAIKVQQREVEP
jgi:hypothetical protein